MISNIVSSAKIIVELFTYLYCLAGLFGQKFRMSIHAVVLIILDLFLLTGIGRYGFPSYLRSLLYVALFIYSLLYYEESIKRTLINCTLAAIMLACLQLIICVPLYFLNIKTLTNQEELGLLINVLCMLITITCGKRICFRRFSDFFQKSDKLIFTISALIFISIGINLYKVWTSRFIFGEQYIQLIYFLFLLCFMVGELQKSRLDIEKKKTQLELNKLYYDAYDQLIMLVRERQHDTKNHINAILSMIYTTESYEELVAKQKQYCDFVMEQNEETKLLLSSGNPLVIGFLYSKIQKAKCNHIDVVYEIDMKKTDMLLPEYELVEMIGILFDNAEEALQKDGEEDKRMYVSIKQLQNRLEIVIANTSDIYEDDVTERFFESDYSNKGNGRGIGLSKLKRLVHKRNGEITVGNEKHDGKNYLTFEICFVK